MKKFISLTLCITICFNLFCVFGYANETNDMSLDNFYNQVNHLAESFDTNDGLAFEGSETYLTNRLIVKTNSNDPLPNYYGASAVVEGYDCLHFLQYSSEEEAEYAYIKFSYENIEYVEYDFYLDLYAETDGQESNEHISWNSSVAQVDDAFNYINDMNIECEEVRIAIIDSGVYKKHEFFNLEEGGSDRIVDCGYTYDVTKTDGNGGDYVISYPSTEDDLFHGTFVAGVIYDNSMENIKIVPFRITNSIKTPYSRIVHALSKIIEINTNETADDDIDIINMSFATELNILDSSCYTMANKLDEAANLGIVLIAAAGNSHDSCNEILPAAYSKAITVSATDEYNKPASFSNFGDSVDIGAPGVNITSPTPRLFTDDNDDEVCAAYNAYMTDNGTSFSAPLVAAAAATLKSIDPDITPAEIERIIKESAFVPDDWKENCNGQNYGTGIVNFYNMVKAVLEPEYSTTPTIKINADNNFEITAPENTDSRIYYTIDGTTPTINNHISYTEPFNLKNKYVSKITAVCHENGKLIGEPVTYNTITYESKTIFYKWSDSLSTDSKFENANWRSYNPDIVSVSNNGEIKGVSKGDTRITAILSTGERVIWTVNVKYSPIQAFFVMFFFGFLWV